MSRDDTQADLAGLAHDFAIEGAVTFAASPLGGIVATLTGAGGTAEVALKGAQVIAWRPLGASELLWRNPAGRLDTAKPLRGGIPVCWPWFGPHAADPAKPAHGFARTAHWRVGGTAREDGSAAIRLHLAPAERERALWPEAGSAEIEVTAGRDLSVALVTRNHGTSPLAVSAALHTYLGIGDIGAVTVEGLDGATFIDRLDEDRRHIQRGPLGFFGEVDRVYLDRGCDVVVADRLLRRRIRVVRGGSRSVVVWTPWAAKAARLGDVAVEDWRRILCVEAANTADDTVTIPPGGMHQLSTTLSIEPSAG